MERARRRFLHLAASAATLLAVPRIARAQDFPTRPVRLVVPFAAGGPTDVVARILGDQLSARWRGQPVVVENRAGAGTILGTAVVAKSPADGYTILLANSSFFINQAIGQKLPYDALSDFFGIGTIGSGAIALVANKAFPPNTMPELVAFAKRSAEPINFASPGPRGTSHLAGEWLKQLAGIRMQHSNYNGSAPALTDVIAGRVPIMFDVWHSSRPHVNAGNLKLIAATGTERLKDAPQVPTIGETYPGFDVAGFQFIVGPAGIPADVAAQISGDLRAIVDSAAFVDRAQGLGIDARGSTPQELDGLIRKEMVRWTDIAKAANIKVE